MIYITDTDKTNRLIQTHMHIVDLNLILKANSSRVALFPFTPVLYIRISHQMCYVWMIKKHYLFFTAVYLNICPCFLTSNQSYGSSDAGGKIAAIYSPQRGSNVLPQDQPPPHAHIYYLASHIISLSFSVSFFLPLTHAHFLKHRK